MTCEDVVGSSLRSIRPDLSPEIIKKLLTGAIGASTGEESHERILDCVKVSKI
jgi:hypothetical protein